ncbi:hypothetical protein BO86DRAFT_394239 [Aspergillus japonicus CBS 114.51]|uniref:Uncharacterized protein n=1 Tax=Aspergillus japonicus CBS 114.51 TaxID=1448312 RepID=A0A8T8XHQ2_ASPJA|nr:hypothetical protein BO86DRAFT_394239 [Aspergillus japonicus CBS 114.51]RAH87438.1 hypothetical protein BO86DRAFT_394239 [Aspergillus japonicus CBS 114.51]
MKDLTSTDRMRLTYIPPLILLSLLSLSLSLAEPLRSCDPNRDLALQDVSPVEGPPAAGSNATDGSPADPDASAATTHCQNCTKIKRVKPRFNGHCHPARSRG